MPPVKAPSPITAIILLSSFFKSLARAMPSAADIDVLLWPVSKESYLLSFLFGNPLIPLYFLSLSNLSFLPVSILCMYVWCPTSQTILSFSKSNSLNRLNVSSTTPKFDAKCPPVFDTESIKKLLISSDNSYISGMVKFLTSLGDFILFKISFILSQPSF